MQRWTDQELIAILRILVDAGRADFAATVLSIVRRLDAVTVENDSLRDKEADV